MAHQQKFKKFLGAAALALGALVTAPAAHALDFVFTDTGATPMSTAQFNAVKAAGDYWSSKISSNVTVYINIGFDSLGSSILGSTGSNVTTASYTALRSSLVSHATSALDATAVSNLQVGSALTFMATQGDLTSRLDNDGSTNNTTLGITTANAKALGFNAGTSAAIPDASMTFSSDFAFSYTRVAQPGVYDFITVAEHEIGHALGFVSGVDDIDYCVDHPTGGTGCGLSGLANEFEGDWWYYPMDLFRYSAAGVLDERVGGSPYFSVTGGATAMENFATGESHGDGWQASHFGPGAVNLMRPFVGAAQIYDASANDLAMMDVLGWTLAQAVPEPGSTAMMLLGIVGIACVVRRRRAD